MEETRKHLLDRFQEHLCRNFETYCLKHGIDQNEDRLIIFLIDQDLIPATHLKRYAVKKEYELLQEERSSFQKTQMVSILAHRFNISERTVWEILKHKGQ